MASQSLFSGVERLEVLTLFLLLIIGGMATPQEMISASSDKTNEAIPLQEDGRKDAKMENKPVLLCSSSFDNSGCYKHNPIGETGNKSSGELTLCDKGLELLRNIGDDCLIPVCVTGPARTGKSTFLSLLQDGIKFEIGHTTTRQTVGIWCALGEMVKIDGKKARMVLVDTEGIRSVSTQRDQLTHHTWDSKILSLSLLISTFFIYNNSKIPTMDDLNQLEFLSNFVSTLQVSTSNEKKQMSKSQNKTTSPHFIWLIRDASLSPVVGNEQNDWNTYVNELLDLNETRLQTGNIVTTIKNIFQSVTAFGIPMPSLDEKILSNLVEHSGSKVINPNFSKAIKKVTMFIKGKRMLKQHGGLTLTGNMMAEMIPKFVEAINNESEKIPINNMWDNFIRAQLQKKQEDFVASLSQRIKKIELPTAIKNLEDLFQLLLDEVKNEFSMFDERISSNVVQKVESNLRTEFDKLEESNEAASETFCSNLYSKLIDTHLNPLRAKLPLVALSEFKEASQMINDIYLKEAKGPKADKMKRKLEERLETESNLASTIVCESIMQILKTTCSAFVSDTSQNAPYEEEDLKKKWDFSKERLWEEFKSRSKILPHKEMEQCGDILKNFFEGQYLTLSVHNENQSKTKCEGIMQTLIEEKLEKNVGKIFFDFDSAVKDITVQYKKDAIGPQREAIQNEYENKINSLAKKGKESATKKILTYTYSGACMVVATGAAVYSAPVSVLVGLGGVAVYLFRSS